LQLRRNNYAKSQQQYEPILLTTFIKELKGRQEEVPLLAEFIDKAKCEPLHLKNNTVKELFMKILHCVLTVANIPSSIKKISELPKENLLIFLIGYVSKGMNCNYLGKKLRQWFDESSNWKKEKQFSFRFRGKESFNYLQHFPSFPSELLQQVESRDTKLCHYRIIDVAKIGLIFC